MPQSGFRSFRNVTSQHATVLCAAGQRPMRVVVSVVGGVVALGTDPVGVLNGVVGIGEVYFVDPLLDAVVIIDPYETLYAAGAVGTGEGADSVEVSCAFSEGLDYEHLEQTP